MGQLRVGPALRKGGRLADQARRLPRPLQLRAAKLLEQVPSLLMGAGSAAVARRRQQARGLLDHLDPKLCFDAASRAASAGPSRSGR